jgi:orotate phosphoribosyltransferase-like protein
MQPGDVIVAVAFAGVAIGALIFLGSSFQRWIAYKQRKVEVEAEALRVSYAARSDDYADILEERVRVLERIATDRGQDIAHQIESLRDLRSERVPEARKEAS